MEYIIGTKCDPCTLKVQIRSLQAGKLLLQVYDPAHANTVLANRIIDAQGHETHTCYVPMPVSPWEARLRVVPAAGGKDADAFQIVEVRKMQLATFHQAIDWSNAEMHQAIQLGNRFCYNLGTLSTLPIDQAYCSPDGVLKIKYLPVLDNPDTGQEAVTPMRIDDHTNIMEASQKKCIPFTVAGRAVMFFHEYSHKFENEHPDWELEADLNGLTIYLALGWSRYEALQVYHQVFNQVDSPENRDRLAHIEDFIKNFEYYIKKTKK